MSVNMLPTGETAPLWSRVQKRINRAVADAITTMTVVEHNGNGTITITNSDLSDSAIRIIPAVAGLAVQPGDSVLVVRVGGRELATTNLTRASYSSLVFPSQTVNAGKRLITNGVEPVWSAFTTFWGAPVDEETIYRTGAATGTFNSTGGTALASLQITLSGLSTAITYRIVAGTSAVLQAAVAGTFVDLGIRIGTGGTPAYGYGHTLATLSPAGATLIETVSGVTSIQINSMVRNSVAGTQTIGGGYLTVTARPQIAI